jgi:hypothetical protein
VAVGVHAGKQGLPDVVADPKIVVLVLEIQAGEIAVPEKYTYVMTISAQSALLQP